MGAWGCLPFDDDCTNDWAYGLEECDDLSLVESAFDALEEVGTDYLEVDAACSALGACEVLARLLGHPGYTNAYTEKVDQWVAAHPMKPSQALLQRASASIDRVLGDNSELRQLWDESEQGADWHKAIEDLRQRVRA
jgi:hypothetical protein